jgi:hypothetical protein
MTHWSIPRAGWIFSVPSTQPFMNGPNKPYFPVRYLKFFRPTTYTFISGVFKKRPSFFNSFPISIESTLQLLSAPSVRYWQQTVICLVSLWALVVELHPLNWVCAQAVGRIRDKVTMKELEEQRVCECMYVRNFAANLVIILQRHSIA